MHKLKQYTKGDFNIWIIVVLLCILSIPLIYSSTNNLAIQERVSNSSFLLKQLFFIGLGITTIYFSHSIDYKIYGRLGVLMFWASIPLLIYTYFFGISINNAHRWIAIPGTGLTLQTSEIAKTAMIIYLARYLAYNQHKITSWKTGFLPALFPIAIVTLFVLPANLSTALFIMFIGFILLYIGRAKIMHLLTSLLIVAIPIIMLVSWVVLSHNNEWNPKQFPYGRMNVWVTRIDHFLYDTKQDKDYQIQQSKIAIVNGGMLGVGPGNSSQKNFLPSAFSDYIFSIIVEEYGLIGSSMVIILYLLIGFRSIQVFRRCPYAFGSLLCIGLSFDLLLSALFNVAVNADLLPVTGITLPFLSRGGTSFIMSCFQIGIILSVSRINKIEEEIEPEPVNTDSSTPIAT